MKIFSVQGPVSYRAGAPIKNISAKKPESLRFGDGLLDKLDSLEAQQRQKLAAEQSRVREAEALQRQAADEQKYTANRQPVLDLLGTNFEEKVGDNTLTFTGWELLGEVMVHNFANKVIERFSEENKKKAGDLLYRLCVLGAIEADRDFSEPFKRGDEGWDENTIRDTYKLAALNGHKLNMDTKTYD